MTRLSDDTLRRTLAAKAEHKTVSATARALGYQRSTVRDHEHEAARRGLLGFKPVLPGFEIKQTSTQKDDAGNVEKEWIQQRPARGEKFALPPGHIVKGISARADADGNVFDQWIKTKLDNAIPDLVAALTAVFKAYKGKARPAARPVANLASLLSVYPIADLHLGMQAWRRETGEAYDLSIAIRRAKSMIAQLVAQAPASRTALILNLGDWQHNDDQRNATPRSHHQLDVDSRYPKILAAGVELMIELIELAKRRHAHVIVRNLPGNHDPHASVALTLALKFFYARDKRVTIDDDPGEFFFHRFGATLIGAHHGHKAKPDRLAMAMAVNRREDWGATHYHQFFFGHIHHETAKEVGDVRVESFQTIAGKDAHAAGGAYVSGKSLVSVTIHRRDGEIGRHRVNIAPPRIEGKSSGKIRSRRRLPVRPAKGVRLQAKGRKPGRAGKADAGRARRRRRA